MWFVIVERTDGKRSQRMIVARTAEEAGLKACALLGGPNAHLYRVVRCDPAE